MAKLDKKVNDFIKNKFYSNKTLVNKGTGEEVEPEKLLDIIFRTYKEVSKTKEVEKFLGTDLIDDIMFSKINQDKKVLQDMFGDTFTKAFNNYKKGKGAKSRKEIAKYILTKRKDQKQIDLNKRIDQMIKNSKVVNANPQPDNPYVRFVKGQWVDYSPKALAEQLKDARDDAVKKHKEEEHKRAMSDAIQFVENLNKAQEKIQSASLKIKKIAEPLEAINKSLKPQKDAMDKLNPVDEPFRYKVFPGLLGLLNEKPLVGNTILGSTFLRPQVPKVKPEGSTRKAVTGTGINTYMDYHKLKNPVEIAKKYLTKEGKFKSKGVQYELTGYDNLRWLCEQMNVTVQEAFLYICEGMTSTKHRWLLHRVEKEFWRGSQAVINLVMFFDEKVALSKNNKNKITYTLKMLWQSEYYKNFVKEHDAPELSYSKFTHWFKQMRHHVDVLKLANKNKKS